jgi:phosphoribosyl-ATP pyrophosphohydrolase
MFTLQDLETIIAARATAEKSYTQSLLAKGANYTAKKFGEEAIELVIAAASQSTKDVVYEAADVLYHLLVVLKSRDVSLTDVLAELQRRTSLSGLEEKASR